MDDESRPVQQKHASICYIQRKSISLQIVHLLRMCKILRWIVNIGIEGIDGNIITQLHGCALKVEEKTKELQQVRISIASKSGVQSPLLKKAPPMWEETPNEVIQNN